MCIICPRNMNVSSWLLWAAQTFIPSEGLAWAWPGAMPEAQRMSTIGILFDFNY